MDDKSGVCAYSRINNCHRMKISNTDSDSICLECKYEREISGNIPVNYGLNFIGSLCLDNYIYVDSCRKYSENL